MDGTPLRFSLDPCTDPRTVGDQMIVAKQGSTQAYEGRERHTHARAPTHAHTQRDKKAYTLDTMWS
jgi:hypothetical protein